MNNLELLKELRQEKGDTQSDVASALNISQKAYSYYERGEREPSIDMLIQISNYFNVTVDYLLGREKSKYYELSEDEYNLIKKYRMLSERSKGKINERIDIIKEMECKK
ncbi:helix-turn-helix transcriptional regulator [Ruminococcus sp.]|uniref:helix-turn-helix domain-containing protein n=1 Tax=Ruminococcus sp. TaxID=41978 RepID=UPI0025CE6C40|nr:helix-turn-helix transcriptional regulator [Ruminococcus sp.]MBR1431654.1 helix-turn-helix transcriptional regulator [Ruminococcus sp.]